VCACFWAVGSGFVAGFLLFLLLLCADQRLCYRLLQWFFWPFWCFLYCYNAIAVLFGVGCGALVLMQGYAQAMAVLAYIRLLVVCV
jgi:hypothetical protein